VRRSLQNQTSGRQVCEKEWFGIATTPRGEYLSYFGNDESRNEQSPRMVVDQLNALNVSWVALVDRGDQRPGVDEENGPSSRRRRSRSS
jgi:hypothetical protein